MAVRTPVGIAIPHLLWLVLFVLAPLGFMLKISFQTPVNITGFSESLTLANYLRMLAAPYPGLLLDSLAVAAITTALCVLFALPLAMAIARLHPRMRTPMLFVVCLPFWISAVVRTYALQEILGRKGLINSAYEEIWNALAAIIPSIGSFEPLPLLYSTTGVIIGLVYAFIPFAVLPIFASLTQIDSKLLEASRDLGASAFTTAMRITLPIARPGLAAASFLVFIPTLGAFYIAEMLGGPNDVLMGSLLKLQFYEANNWPFGAALSVALMLLAILMLAALRPRVSVKLA